jgi:hypothetical protein
MTFTFAALAAVLVALCARSWLHVFAAELHLRFPPIFRASARKIGGKRSEVLDHVEATLSHAFPGPGHARVAAGVFTSSLAIICAGAVGVVALAFPHPVLDVRDLTGRASAAERDTQTVAAAATDAGPAVAAPATTTTTAVPAAPAAPAADATAPVAPPTNRVLPGSRGALPIGKGMWIWLPERAENGDANAVVERARTWGLTHLYVRTGTLKEGFVAAAYLDKLLPAAHAAGLRVYGWDFPYMTRPGDDVNRALAAITYTTPDGHRIDGFAPDIETKFEGVNENVEFVNAYVTWLRQNVGNDYPLIAVVPNPTPGRVARGYPYPQIVAPFDAVAPMVYWMDRDPGPEVQQAISYLSQFGKPVFPVGQAYDGGIDGGAPGVPNRASILRFMQQAEQSGADSVSFWSWQHASGEAWDAIGDSMEFRLGHGAAEALRPPMIRAYQLELNRLGFPVARTGEWNLETITAVTAFQRSRGIPETGLVDLPTRTALLAPVTPTVRPYGS